MIGEDDADFDDWMVMVMATWCMLLLFMFFFGSSFTVFCSLQSLTNPSDWPSISCWLFVFISIFFCTNRSNAHVNHRVSLFRKAPSHVHTLVTVFFFSVVFCFHFHSFACSLCMLFHSIIFSICICIKRHYSCLIFRIYYLINVHVFKAVFSGRCSSFLI